MYLDVNKAMVFDDFLSFLQFHFMTMTTILKDEGQLKSNQNQLKPRPVHISLS